MLRLTSYIGFGATLPAPEPQLDSVVLETGVDILLCEADRAGVEVALEVTSPPTSDAILQEGSTPDQVLLETGQDYVLLEPPAGMLVGKTAPAAAYSIRLLLNDYTGPAIELTRTSDSASDDFYPDIFGNLQNASAQSPSSWGGGATLLVDTWYDQSGNGYDMAITGGSRPTFLPSGAGSNFNGGEGALDFTANSNWLSAGDVDVADGQSGLTVMFMMTTDVVDANEAYVCKSSGGSTGPFFIGQDTGGPATGRMDTFVVTTGTRTDKETNFSNYDLDTPHLWEFVFDSSVPTMYAYIDSTDMGSASPPSDTLKTTSEPLLIGLLNGNSGYGMDGQMIEVIIWNEALGTTERENIRDAMDAFYK